MVPAQWVPCPCLSKAQLVSDALHSLGVLDRTSKVGMARPPKSLCVVRMPVSAT